MKNRKPSLIKTLLIALVVLMFVTNTNAQTPASGLIVGINVGASKMITEVSSDFKQHYTEFDQKSGFSADLEIAKPLFNHFEIGTSIGVSNLGGILEDPSGSNNKYKIFKDQYFIRDLEGPLEYKNRLVQQKFFVAYYFRSFSNISKTLSPEPFIRAGAGYISYGVELYESSESIWGKGTDDYADIAMSSTLFFATAGVKTYVSPNFFLNLTFTCNYTNYDYLDAVFNYNSEQERLGFGGIYSEFRIGIFYQLAGKEKREGKSKNGLGPNLPFSR